MMKLKQTYDFKNNPEDFEICFERAIQEAEFEARLERYIACQQFSELEKNFYEKLYSLEHEIVSRNNNFTKEEFGLLAKYKYKLRMQFAFDEKNYMIFVHLKQCEAFQKDLILNNIDINNLQTDEDTKNLVYLFIKNYPILELMPPSNPLYGRFAAKNRFGDFRILR